MQEPANAEQLLAMVRLAVARAERALARANEIAEHSQRLLAMLARTNDVSEGR